MWIRRKEHFRNASAGPERSKVSASVYFRPDTRGTVPPQGWDEACPLCGAHIIVSRPAHGGTAISEVLPSGARIPHPCFDRLRGKRASEETLDLFEWLDRA
ncbi:MAG: hypothetical protein ACK46Q_17025 [Hyphomonas sp.]